MTTELFPMSKTLDDHERAELARYEGIVNEGLKSFIEVGEALDRIKQGRLYRETHRSFKAYVKKKWGFGDSRSRQIRGAAAFAKSVATEFSTSFDNEKAVAKFKAALKKFDPELRPAIIKLAAAKAEASQRNLTAGDLREVGEVLNEAVTTGGYVDTGDGTQYALTSAVSTSMDERQQRQKAHIEERSRWQFSRVVYGKVKGDTLDLSPEDVRAIRNAALDGNVKIIVYVGKDESSREATVSSSSAGVVQ